jgi:two-component system chemotaxis response regulator CheY
MTLQVLAVDDSFTMRELLRHVLTAAGFSVETADDGMHGVERLSEVMPDVIVTDLNMPRMDGFGFIQAVRAGEVASRAPILVLTTESAEPLKQRARTAGANGWIVKPFDEAALVSAIRRVAAW